MCEHVGLECPAMGCWCECERCEDIRQICGACDGQGGFASSGEVCSDCLGTGSIPANALRPLERGQEARHAAEFKSLERPEWSAEPWKA